MKRVVIHRLARTELDKAMAFYERQKSGLGLDLQAEVERLVARIQENPKLGSTYKTTEFRYRVLRRFPFVIYNAELEQVIWVVAIAHGRRRPGYWRKRRRT